jgi:hypothetical protein
VSSHQVESKLPTSTSTGSKSSQYTGTPISWQTTQSQYDTDFAKAAFDAGVSQYGWAKDQYTKNQDIADYTIPKYETASGKAMNLADEQLNDYNNLYRPAMKQFADTAATYASAPRIAANMGKAEAGETQAAAKSWDKTRQSLQAAGIADPSGGIYGEMMRENNLEGGAAAAGAGNQARESTEKTGLELQEQNINFGSTLPASALNAINTGYTGLTDTSNTQATATNTGATAADSANKWYNSALNIQQAPSGTQTQGTSTDTTSSRSAPTTSTDTWGNIGTGGGTIAGGGVVHSYARGGGIPHPRHGRGGGKRGHGRGAGGGGGGGGGGGAPSKIPGPGPTAGHNAFLNSDEELARAYGESGGGGGGGRHIGGGGGGGQRSGGGGGGGGPDLSDQGIPTPTDNTVVPSGAPGPIGGAQAQPSDGPTSQDTSGDDDSGGYAHGGGIPDHYHVHGLPDAVSGGHIPYGLSPSHGHTTDDVVANLNAGEFVIPRDVTHYYGHKFFYDLINKGRKGGLKGSQETRGNQPPGGKAGSDEMMGGGRSNEPPKQNFYGGGI